MNEFGNLTDFTKDIFGLRTKINFSTSAYKKDYLEYWEYDSNGNYIGIPYKERNPQLYYQNRNKIIYQLVY